MGNQSGLEVKTVTLTSVRGISEGAAASITDPIFFPASSPQHSVAWGFKKLLRFIDQKYTRAKSIPIIIAENGFPVDGEAEMEITQLVQDHDRQKYFAEYIKVMIDCVREDGIAIEGYMAWSLIE